MTTQQDAVADYLRGAARSRVFFADYTSFVHEWTPRPHQREAFSALQALADGKLAAGETCDLCRTTEREWIAKYNLLYKEGYRVYCGECPTTVDFLWLAFYGSGKSDTLIEWMAWLIGRTAQQGAIPQCGWVSYADDVADLRSVAIRDTIEFNERYHHVFPECRPWKKKGWGEGEWFLDRKDKGQKDPTFRSAGISGAVLAYRFPTGEVLDDPQDPNQIKSQIYRDDSWYSFRRVVKSRASGERTPKVVISNRWAEDDIPGRLMTEGGWRIVITPALDMEDESIFPAEMWRGIPVGKSTSELHREREQDRPGFMIGYMCQPPSQEGDLFQHFAEGESPIPEKVQRCVQFWDTATTDKTSSDPCALAEGWKLQNGRTFVNKALIFKRRPAEVVEVMLREYYRAEDEGLRPLIVIENAQSGPMFAAWLQKYSGVRVKLHNWGGFGKMNAERKRGPKDLYSRAVATVGHLEGGIVYYPAGWKIWSSEGEDGIIRTSKDEVFTQLKGYRGKANTSHDDYVAAQTGLIEYLYPIQRKGRPVRTFEVHRV